MPICSRVRHEYQLDGSVNGPWDCGRAGAVTLVDHGSRGIYRPSTERIGVRMGDTKGVSNVLSRQKGVQSYDQEMKRKGYRPLKYKLAGKYQANGWILSGAGKMMLLHGIKRGEMADVTINYDVLRKAAPAYITSTTGFKGMHTVTAGGKRGYKKKGGAVWVRVLDPIAKRSRWWKFSWLWKAADGTWSSKGSRGWVGGLVKCAEKLSKPPSTVVPDPDPCEAEVIALRDRSAELETTLGDAQDIIESLEGRRIPNAIKADIALLAAEIKSYVEPPDTGQKPKVGAKEIEA